MRRERLEKSKEKIQTKEKERDENESSVRDQRARTEVRRWQHSSGLGFDPGAAHGPQARPEVISEHTARSKAWTKLGVASKPNKKSQKGKVNKIIDLERRETPGLVITTKSGRTQSFRTQKDKTCMNIRFFWKEKKKKNLKSKRRQFSVSFTSYHLEQYNFYFYAGIFDRNKNKSGFVHQYWIRTGKQTKNS